MGYYVTGYTHSDGYCLCPEHANYGDMEDEGNESGKVQAIFDTDEWDTNPTCDVCLAEKVAGIREEMNEIEVVNLTEIHEQEEFESLRRKVERQEQSEAAILVYYDVAGKAYCRDCFEMHVLDDHQVKIKELYQDILADNVTGNPYVSEVIRDNDPSEILPREIVACCHCDSWLYEPDTEEPEEEHFNKFAEEYMEIGKTLEKYAKKYTYHYQVKYTSGHTTTSEVTVTSIGLDFSNVDAHSWLKVHYPDARIVSLILIKIDDKNVTPWGQEIQE